MVKPPKFGSLAESTWDVGTPKDLAVRQSFLLTSLEIVNMRYLYIEVKQKTAFEAFPKIAI